MGGHSFKAILLAAVILFTPTLRVGAQPVDQVVVLHGLGRSSMSMWLLASRLTEAGFEVHNLDYPSTEETIDRLVEMLDGELETCCLSSGERLHFVTHSLGGILVRAYISQKRPHNLGRVVMLSPPNQGSELVDELRDSPLFQWATGPAGQELGTDPSNLPNQLGPADFEVGIITGSLSLNPLTSWLVTGEDDGKVSVENAQLEGMADFLVVPNTHTFIMNSSQVAREVVHFLEQGTFSIGKSDGQ
jgi:pimeloyl-ACP methyl ester carboxylesterase